jgi:hypothetical protein
MPIPTPDKLGLYYPSKDLTTANAATTPRTTAAGSTSTNIVVTNVSEATDYWNGANGFFITGTADNLGVNFHVKKWNASNNTLTLAAPLPAAPAASDTFVMFVGGKAASTTEVLALKVAGVQPELGTGLASQIAGITFRKASALLGEGNLQIYYTYTNATTKTLKIRMGADDYGTDVPLTANATALAIFDKYNTGFILVDITYASLPTSTQNKIVALTTPKGTIVPNYEGYETNDGIGRSRYHLIVAKNKADAVDTMNAITAWTTPPVATTAAVAGASFTATTAPGMLQITTAAAPTWPTRGFWVWNKTKDDLRYVDYRTNNQCYTKAVNWGTTPFKNGTAGLVRGAVVANAATITPTTLQATIDQVIVETGTLAGNNATGKLILKNYVTTAVLGNTTNIYVNGAIVAAGNGTSVRGYRGKTLSSSWTYSTSAPDTVLPISDIDIGFELPDENGLFSNPPDENTAPVGVNFGLYPDVDNSLTQDFLEGGGMLGIWIRETILDGTQARENLINDLNFTWF